MTCCFSLGLSGTACVLERRQDDQQPWRVRKDRHSWEPLSKTSGGSVPIRSFIFIPGGMILTRALSGCRLAI